MRKDGEEEWGFQEFRRVVLEAAGRAGFERPADLARAAGLRDGMLSKWFNGRERPSMDSLRKLAEPLPGITATDLALLVGRLEPDEIKGTRPRPPQPRLEVHSLALELGRMLAEDSPLTAEQRERLVIVVDHSMDPFRRHMKRRRSSGPVA